MMNNHSLITTAYKATTAIPKGGRFVSMTAAKDGEVSLATDATKVARGVAVYDMAVEAGRTVDVIEVGIAPVQYAGNITADDSLTTDGSGCAIKAAPASGVTVFCPGFAEFSGVAGDRGAIRLSPHFLKG